ncbi:MAG: T9SS type A sorting domain-containing protein [Flavobacterium sp.]|nr:MAG: T9SS type A sorting domain-containing protein [Flavobacterium sp.]
MKKNYFTALLVLSLGLCFTQKGFAQLPIVANDDVLNNINSAQGGFFYNTFLGNDTLNGNSVNTFSVNVEQVSTTDPGVYITLGGVLNVAPGTPAGTYTVVYKICQSNFTSNCDTASITVNVCNVPAPTFVQQTCNIPASEVTLTNLPANGTWTITLSTQWPVSAQTYTGTGTTFTLVNILPNYYSVQVTDASGCVSPATGVSVGYLGGMDTSLVGTYQDLNGDGIVNIGDIINYQVTINNNAVCELNDVEVAYEEWGGVATVFDSPVASIPAGGSATVTVFYPITQEDINDGAVLFNWFAVRGDLNGYQVYSKAFDQVGVPLNIPDGFKFNAFIDGNGNGTQETNEANFTLGYFQYTVNDATTVHTLYGSDPIVYESGPFMTYDVNFVIYPEYASYYNLVTAGYMDVSIVGNPGVTTYNFPITAIPYQDVAIHMYNGTTATPGFPYVNYITYTNNGNQTIPSGMVSVLADVNFPITASETIIANVNGFTFNFTNLLPFESRTMTFSMQIPTIPTVALGDIVGTVASITFEESDAVAGNNYSVVNTTIVGSYDPNDKAESNNGKVMHELFTEDDYLKYTIRFENMGTANAFTVKVTDVLEDKLDETSVRMIGASHNYTLSRIGSELTWTFNNIQLPPSVINTQTGHGYIAFKVKPKPGYLVGDIFENTASIYFDFNPAIVTNTVNTEFVSFLNIDDFVLNELKVYPNPVKNILNIVSNKSTVESIIVYDLLGKTILSKTVNGTSTMVNVSGLSNGIYLVKIVAAQEEKVFKIVKE